MLHAEAALVVSQIGAICVAVWRQDSTVERVGHQAAALAEVVSSAPGRAGFVCVVEEGSAPPNEEARKASSKMLESHGANLCGVAVIIEGTGFRASIVRSVASGIVLLARSKTRAPVSYHATVEEGARWIARHVEVADVHALVESINATRAALDRYGG
jgi:hypothetical protein